MKRLYAAHPTIFSLVVFAFILDVVMLASTGGLWRDSSFAIGSTLVVVYFFGISSLLRFAIFRNRIHLGITWVFTIVLWFGWFALQVALNQGQYRPSLLFIMCLIVAFKTMRLEQSEEEKNTSSQADEDNQKNLASQSTDSQETLLAPISSSPRKKQKAKAETAQSNPVAPSPSIPSPSIDSCNETGGTGNLHQLKHALGAIAGTGCLLALWDMPEDYYKVLRFLVVAACSIIIWDIQKSSANDTNKTLVSVGFGMLAVFFNPIMPIDLDYDKWLWVRIVALALFLGSSIPKNAKKAIWASCIKYGPKTAIIITSVFTISILSIVLYYIIKDFTVNAGKQKAGVIDDETATKYYNEFDSLTGAERESRADALRMWADQKDADQKREQFDTLNKIYSDFDGYVKEAGLQDFDEDSRYRTANRQFIASQFNQTPEEQQETYSSFRDKWTVSVAGKNGMSEKETFNLIRSHLLAIGKATNSQIKIIDDETAFRILTEAKQATGDEREQMADAVIAYGEKKLQEEYNTNDEHYSKMFMDDAYNQEYKGRSTAIKEAVNPNETWQRGTIQGYLSHRLGRDVTADNYEIERDAFSMSAFGQKNINDGQLFDNIKGDYEWQHKKTEALNDLRMQAVGKAIKDAKFGQSRPFVEGMTEVFNTWQTKYPELVDGANDAAFLSQGYKLYFDTFNVIASSRKLMSNLK